MRSLHAAVELGLGAAQVFLAAAAHRDVGAEREARHRQADHESEQHQERFVQAHMAERPGMLDRGPDGEAGEDHADGRGVARAAPQRRPHQRQDRQEAERARIFRARQQRAEGDQADRDGASDAPRRSRSELVARRKRAPVGLRPQHDRRRHHQARRRHRPATRSPRSARISARPQSPPRISVTTPIVGADHGRRPDAYQREFRHPRGVA